jgi:hypothetical protein
MHPAYKWMIRIAIGAGLFFFVAPMVIDTARLAWAYWMQLLGAA